MTQPFLALITPLAQGPSGPVDPGYNPPGIGGPGSGLRPTHPIAPGGGGNWGQAGDPGYGIPERPVDPGYGVPIGGRPVPTPPIYFPPEGSQPPLGIWGGPYDPPHPTHPIVLPPNLPPVIPPTGGQPERKVEWKTGWTEKTGWVIVGVPAEGTLVPTPSAPGPVRR
jgi:hypothetical protein